MASGKKSKERRREAAAPPPVRSKGAAARKGNPRVLLGVAGLVALVTVGVVLAVVLMGGSGSGVSANTPSVGSVANGLPGAADVESLFHGIPQHGLTLGKSTAPVKMVTFIDLQCPLCREFETTTMTDVIPRYVRTGKVQVQVKPWAFIGPDSVRGQGAMLAAAKQNKAFNFAQVLYDNQGEENSGWLTDNVIAQAAASIPGLRVDKVLANRSAASIAGQQRAVAADAKSDGVTGTPTVLVGRAPQRPSLVGSAGLVPTEAQVTAALNAALR